MLNSLIFIELFIQIKIKNIYYTPRLNLGSLNHEFHLFSISIIYYELKTLLSAICMCGNKLA
jgi:hypothetical protein